MKALIHNPNITQSQKRKSFWQHFPKFSILFNSLPHNPDPQEGYF